MGYSVQDVVHDDIDFSSGNKKVIVTLKEPQNQFVLVPLSYGGEVKDYQKLQMQNKVFKKLNSNSNVKNKFKSLNGFSAEIDEDSYLNLLSDPNVLSVEIDKPVEAFLSSSVPILGANNLWDKTYFGQNVTGVDQTICVIDTGTDYTHSSLGGCFGPACRVVSGYDYVNGDSDPMDDHGHGTHVSGILISSDSTNRGVAPGARIVSLKALDFSGSGSVSDVVSSIDWCITYKDDYNISVISMSLGDPTFLANSTCDSYDTSMRTIINSAVANNLTVFAASGNEGNVTGISAPSCMTNATSVGSVTDSLVFSSFSNRGELLDFTAPGSSITSTKIYGGSITASGTSMATPHVAAAAILLRSFKLLENGSFLSVEALNNLFYRTGFIVSESGNNYTGVNITSAFLELDVNSPQISLNVLNNSVNLNNSSVYFEVSSNENIYDVVLSLNSVNYSMNGSVVDYYFNFTNLSSGVYNFSINGRDFVGNEFNTGLMFFRIGNNAPNITFYSPSNLSLDLEEFGEILFNLNYSDLDGDSVSVSWLRDGILSSSLDNYSFVANYTDENFWNITAIVSDGFSTSSIYWSLNVTINDPPVFYDVLNITVNETETVVLNVSAYDPEGENLTYTFSSPFDSNGEYTTLLGGVGNYTTTVIASDSVKNTSKVYYYEVILNVSVEEQSSSSGTSESSSDDTSTTSTTTVSSAGGGGGGGSVSSSSINRAPIINSFDLPIGVSNSITSLNNEIPKVDENDLEILVNEVKANVGNHLTGGVVQWFSEPTNNQYIVVAMGLLILLFSMFVKFGVYDPKVTKIKFKKNTGFKVKNSNKVVEKKTDKVDKSIKMNKSKTTFVDLVMKQFSLVSGRINNKKIQIVDALKKKIDLAKKKYKTNKRKRAKFAAKNAIIEARKAKLEARKSKFTVNKAKVAPKLKFSVKKNIVQKKLIIDSQIRRELIKF